MQNFLLILVFLLRFLPVALRWTEILWLLPSSCVYHPFHSNKSTLLKVRFLNDCQHLTCFYYAFYQGIDWLKILLHLSTSTSQSEYKCFLVRANQIQTSPVCGAMIPALTASGHEVATVVRIDVTQLFTQVKAIGQVFLFGEWPTFTISTSSLRDAWHPVQKKPIFSRFAYRLFSRYLIIVLLKGKKAKLLERMVTWTNKRKGFICVAGTFFPRVVRTLALKFKGTPSACAHAH